MKRFVSASRLPLFTLSAIQSRASGFLAGAGFARFCFGVAALMLAADLPAQTAKTSKAVVRQVQGQVQYKSKASGKWMPLKVGQSLKTGAIVEAATNSSSNRFSTASRAAPFDDVP